MGWNDYESKQVRALRGISTRSEKPNKDLETNIRNLNNSVRYMSSMMGIMQEGIDDANRDILQQFSDAIQDLMIIFNLGGGGDTLNLDWGDLGVVLKNISSIFRFDFFNLDLPDIDLLGWAQEFWDNTFGNLDILNFERLKEAFNGEYVGPDIALNIIQNVIRTIKRLASGIIAPWRLPQISVSSITNEPGPNLLSSFGGFNAAEDIAGDGIWVFDPDVGKTAPGSARTDANGTLKVLSSEAIAVSAGQTLQVGGWVKWQGAVATGSAFRILVVPYIGSLAQTPVQISTLNNPAANGENTFPMTDWTVPASVDAVRVRVTVEASVTSGTVWWDDLVLRKAGSTLPQSFIGGLGQRLQDLDDNDTGLDDAIGKLAGNINNAISATVEDVGEGVGDILEAFNTIFNLNRQSKAAEAAALEAKQMLAAMNNQEETGGDGMAWSVDFPNGNNDPLPSGDWQNVNNIVLRTEGGAGVVGSGGATPAWAATTRTTNTDSQKCSFIISFINGSDQESGVFIRATSDLSSGVLCTVTESGKLFLTRASVSGGTVSIVGTAFLNVTHAAGFKVGDQIEVRCNGTYYYIYKNGKQIYSYNDTGNVVPVGESNRYCGMYMEREQVFITLYTSPRFASFYMSDWYIPPGGPVNGFWQGSLVQYNALTTKLDTVAYFITP
ncbi:minor tail protein [Gordonia phage GretelLyn]|uniref:Minor tail protein n=2 Tax=Lambovirus sadboi TaxID=2844674 RepID=A0A5J6TEL2_9CAUD|nr:minor tail protein [Gordonia phage Sadboi]QFG08169.1 minor tail protein [Gordonia phage GretelLyn]QFG14680.1 minor tail protein [Gordonia phage Sadboi]